LLLWIIFLVRNKFPKYFVKFVGLSNFCFFLCCLIESLVVVIVTTFDYVMYCFKSTSCASLMCFFIEVIPWVNVYCNRPFLQRVVQLALWELELDATWWQNMHCIIWRTLGSMIPPTSSPFSWKKTHTT
jgi:hypothetical protein